MTSRGGIYEGPGGRKLHGDGSEIVHPAEPAATGTQDICQTNMAGNHVNDLTSPAELVCGEAYQLLGTIVFHYPQIIPNAEKWLDNLSRAKPIHDNLLPATVISSVEPAATGTQEGICGFVSKRTFSFDEGENVTHEVWLCRRTKGHLGAHSQFPVPEPVTPQTTELPPLDAEVIEKISSLGEWPLVSEISDACQSVVDCRERQLAAALTQLAALRTSRDALQVSHDRLLKSLKMNYKWVSTRELTSHKPTEDVIAAAEKLTGRGK